MERNLKKSYRSAPVLNAFRIANASGFTLIELLVVVAIISVLTAFVLTFLGGTRGRGVDAAVKATLKEAQIQAEIFYTANGDSYNKGDIYLNVCDANASSGTLGVKGIHGFLIDAKNISGAIDIKNGYHNQGSFTSVSCRSESNAWAAEAPLKNGKMFCVDSKGAAREEAEFLGSSVAYCAN